MKDTDAPAELSTIKEARRLLAEFEKCDEVFQARQDYQEGMITVLEFARKIEFEASKINPPIDTICERISSLYPMQVIYHEIKSSKGAEAAIHFDKCITDIIADVKRGIY